MRLPKQDWSPRVDVCPGCGVRPIFYKRSNRCRPCAARARRETIKREGAGYCSNDALFDWIAVERAWNRQPVGRPLTLAERIHLAWAAAKDGAEWSARELAVLLGMDRTAAAAFAADVRSGRIPWTPRNCMGEPLAA